MPKNNKYIIAERRKRIAEFYLKGMPQFEIAPIVGVTQQQVSKDLKVLQKQWQDSALRDFDEAKSQELAKIDNLEQTYWDAWEKSTEDYQQKMTRAKGSGTKPRFFEKTTKEIIVYGDPRFLNGIQWCIDKRCKILGIDAPQKIEHEGNAQASVIILPSNNRDE